VLIIISTMINVTGSVTFGYVIGRLFLR